MTENAPLHRFSAFVDLTPLERTALHDMIGPESSFNAGKRIRCEGDAVSGMFFLHEGWVLSSIIHSDGSRQVLKVHRSGDIMNGPSLPFETAVASLVALTPAKVSTIPIHKLGMLFAAHPRLAAVLFLNCQEERVTLMDRLAVGGQLGAKHSVAAFLLQLFDGRPPSDGSDAKLHIPLTQHQIADVLGLSPVHVNRVMAALEAEGLIKRSAPRTGRGGHIYEFPDTPRLKSLVDMPERMRRRNPTWLPMPT